MGPFQLDLFATRYNSQLPDFVSPFPDPQAIGVNALSLPWDSWHSLYLFPPPVLLSKVVPRLCLYKGTGVIVAPFHAQSGWFPALLDRSRAHFPLPKDHSLSQVTGEGLVHHHNPRLFNLHAWIL